MRPFSPSVWASWTITHRLQSQMCASALLARMIVVRPAPDKADRRSPGLGLRPPLPRTATPVSWGA